MIWESNFNEDDGKMLEDVTAGYLAWVASSSKYWSSYGSPYAYENLTYGFRISEALYVGTKDNGEDYWSLVDAMANV